ncbi:hypothetical protein NUU61_001179 [Penicillium alfredii]|uniref:Zn(2)-C6 fungal-type domain-containing protein n=1 Tax=Penicillium alfredii TaxID=1506179 RepID=A0A9W9GB04_9EURO|nr:uncharacterized protein NUU61_001179 [Penicillium alfredii]KAJ5115420.1 hypothetical protein NUU61_001179 [Penicillium alfredii]
MSAPLAEAQTAQKGMNDLTPRGARVGRRANNVVDCRKCQLRRIKCDRGLPGCMKCSKRSLECPGYGPRFKWVHGVASRGSLQGKLVPVQNKSAPLGTQGTRHTWNVQYGGPAIEGLSIPRSLSNPLLRESNSPYASHLMPYFTEYVARRLAWVDGPENPWRQIVLPMVEGSETVLSSVLALTAHDLASQYPRHDPWYERFQSISKTYQEKALGRLAQELNTLRQSTTSQLWSRALPTVILASAIILCNNDMLNAQTAGWRVHLQAAREVIRAACYGKTIHVEEFFLQEYYTTSVWTHLTTFHEVNEIVHTPVASSRDAVFMDFVRIVHQITQTERLRANCQQPPEMTIDDIHVQLKLAEGNALELIQGIQFWSEIDRRDCEQLVSMYRHAGLVYSYQALASRPTVEPLIQDSRNQILEHLQCLSGTGYEMFAQDLVWPLFVAGTECQDSRLRQKTIERELTIVMRISRILDRDRMLSFLKTWWMLSDPQCSSWIDLARKQSSECNFVII